MAEPSPTSTPTRATTKAGQDLLVRAFLPLWIAALSLAVIAVVMIVSSVELIHAVRSTQSSVVQLQQQVSDLKSGLGGLLGG